MQRLAAIPDLKCTENVPLHSLTRFAIGGPALILADASTEAALIGALESVRGEPHALIGGGTNLVADDRGFPGVVLRYTANKIEIDRAKFYIDVFRVMFRNTIDKFLFEF